MSKLLLHASAVARDSRAVVFAGESGQGKSTLATLLALRGWDFLGDEPLALEIGDRVSVVAGDRLVRLTARTAMAVGLAGSDDADGKRTHTIAGAAPASSAARLVAILESGERDGVRELGGGECVAALLACAFKMSDEAERLALCTRVAKSVRVVRMALVRGGLEDLAARVEALIASTVSM